MAGGRPRGSRNKLTRGAKEALESAFASIGGEKSLADWAREHPGDFYPLWAKLLPKNVDLTSGGKPLSESERAERLAAILTTLEQRVRGR